MSRLVPFLSAVFLLTLGAPTVLAVRDEEIIPGEIQKRIYYFDDADKDMEYALYVPKSVDLDKPVPLMVALHGLHGNPRQILGYPGLTDQAEKHGIVLVAPMGYNTSGWYGAPSPLARFSGLGKEQAARIGKLSQQDVMNVLELIQEELEVDEDRIYLMGHSMGGGGTLHLAIEFPEIWAGLAPIAPAIVREVDLAEKFKKIPVILVHGDRDRLVPVDGSRKWVEKMKELKMDVVYHEVEGGDHVRIAFDYMPQIFEFLVEKRRSKKGAKEAKGVKDLEPAGV